MDYYGYRQKWLRSCDGAKYADDEDPLSRAWEAAKEEPLPVEATRPGSKSLERPLQLLIAPCYQLQRAQGTEPFHLGSRDAERLLGVPHTTIFYWLEALCDPEGFAILKKVKIGSREKGLTNEYLYLSLVDEDPLLCR